MTTSNSDLAHNFAHGATSGASANMFIEGEVIYSYGHHFPIAKRLNNGKYIFTSDEYSISTSRHKSEVWSCIHGSIEWDAPKCDLTQVIQFQAEKLFDALRKVARSRSRFSEYIDQIRYNIKVAIRASEALGLSMQPIYEVLCTPVAQSITRIRKEGGEFEELFTLFGKAQFLSSMEEEHPQLSELKTR
jgi:hypothetical protein